MVNALREFIKFEAASGLLLIIAAFLAIAIANSPLSLVYDLLLNIPVEIRVGDFSLDKPLLLWVNDGLMALFFFLIGLELKREVVEGELSNPKQVILPAIGAAGGMIVPTAIYVWMNWGNIIALQGWAIPAATDIAFALAVLGLLGKRIPLSLRVFLVTVAIFDDIGAVAIIALFYTNELSVVALGIVFICLGILYLMNRHGVLERTPYLLIGLIMWIALLKSGVHATLAGIFLALFIPIRVDRKSGSPLHLLEHDLHTAVAFGVLPIFAFVNAGISFDGFSFEYLFHPVSFGVLSGLFLGKQIGVFSFCWLSVHLRMASLPADLSWAHIYGASLLCGIGFTMSLFIASLAFENTGVNLLFDERLGILAGSLLSGIFGYLVLRYLAPKRT